MVEGSGQIQAIPEDSSRWVPIREAARLLGVSIDTIRRWDEKGIIHSNRLKGRNRYFDISELQNLKSSQSLTISQAARKLGISTSTLRRLEKSGDIIPDRSHTGERLYSQQKIQDFQTNKPSAQKSFKKSTSKTKSQLFIEQPPSLIQKIKSIVKPKLPLGAVAAVLILLAIAAWGRAISPASKGKSFIAWEETKKLALVNDDQPKGSEEPLPNSQTATIQENSSSGSSANTSESLVSDPRVAGLIRQNLLKNTLNYFYDQEPGQERAIAIDDKGLSFDVYAPAEYLYIDLREDNTKFVVRDHESDVLTIDSDKHIITHEGSQLEIQGTLKLDGNGGNPNEALVSQGGKLTPVWKDLSELFVKNDGDEMTGNLTLTNQSDLRFGGQNTSNYVGFQAPTDITSSLIWTLPSSDGSSSQVLSTNGSGQLSWSTSSGGSSTFTLAGDTGTSQTISDGNTLSILTDSNLTATTSATDTVTISIDADSIDGADLADSITLDAATLTFTDGTNTLLTLTDSGTTGNLSITGDLTISGDDLVMGTNTSGFILVADGTNFNPVAVSGDASLASSGALTITNVTCTDCLNATEIEDIYLFNTGDTATGSYTFTQAAGETFLIDGSTTAHTGTTGVLDINVAAGNAAVDGLNLSFTANDGITAATDEEALAITLTADDADADLFGLVINSAATTNAAAGSYEAAIKIDNAENAVGSMPDAILITATTDTATTDAIDASDAEIVNALNVGANIITGTSYSVDASGTLTLGSSGLDSLTVTTDGTGDGEVSLPTGSISSTEILDDTLLEADLKAVDAAVDEECLTYETTTGDFEWQSCAASSMSSFTLAGDTGTSQTITDGNTLTIATGAILTATAGATDTVTLSVDADSIDFIDLEDTLDLDAALTLNQGTNTWTQSFTGTTTDGLTYSATSLTSGTGLDFNVTNTHTADAAIEQVQFDLTNAQSTAANSNFAGLTVNFTNNPSVAGNTETAMRIQNQATSNTTDNAVTALLTLDNADTSTVGSTVATNALRIINSGDISGGITNAINIDDADITTDIVLQNDESIDNNTDGTINLTATTLQLTGTTFTGNGATTYDAGGAAAITIGSVDVIGVTVTTDGTGTAEVALPAGSIDSTEILDGTIAAADVGDDVLDFAQFQDTLDVDAATDINLGANLFSVDLDSTGDFAIRDGTTNVVLFEDDSTVDVTFPAAGFLTIDASTTANTTTTGVLDINVGAGNAAVDALNIALTVNDGATAATDFEGEVMTLTADDADADLFGLVITSAATTNAGAGSYEALIKLVNAENTAGAVTDAILIDSTSATDTDITDAIDVSDDNITNALNIGANTILGTTGVIDFTDFDVGADGNVTLAPDGAGDALTINFGAAADLQGLVIDATTNDSTQTAGLLDLNVDTATNTAVGGLYLTLTAVDDDAADTIYGNRIDFTVQDDTTASDTVYGEYIDITQNDTTPATTYGLAIVANDAGAAAVTAGLLIDNLQATDIDITDGILIRATTDASIADAIDVSDAEITNALNVGANTITGTSYSIDASGALTLGSAGLDSLTVTTDGTGTGEVVLPTDAVGSTEILDGDLLEVDLKVVDTAADEECLTFESTGGDFEWQSCGGASTTTLNEAYGNDADGSDAVIALTTADDSIEIDNPAASGTDSTFAFFIDQNDTTGVTALDIDSEATDDFAVNILHAGDASTNTAAALSITAESGAGGLFVTRNLGAGDDDALVEILSDHASGDQPALLIDNDATAGLAFSIVADNTTGDVVDISAAALTTANTIDIPDLDLLTTGKGLNVASGSEAITSGELLTLALTSSGSANSAKTGALSSLAASRTDTRTTGTTADDYDLLGLTRTNIQNGAGGTTTATGSVLRIENVATQTAGTLTDTVALLELVQDPDSTGFVMRATDGTNNTLEMKNLSTNFGGALNAGAFINRNSYFGDEFTRERADQTGAGDAAQQYGDDTAWGGYSAGTNCTYATPNDTTNGVIRLQPTAANVGCAYIVDEAANDARLILDADNLPILLMKVKPSQADTTSGLYVGMADATDSSASAAPANFIGFSNDNAGTLGSTWQGITRSSSTSTTVTCTSQTVSTTAYALLMVEVRSNTNVRFFVDTDVSNGIGFTECGSGSATNIPTAALAPHIQWQERTGGTANTTLDTDFFRAWQDDAPAGAAPQVAAAVDVKKVEADLAKDSSLAEIFASEDLELPAGTLVSVDINSSDAKVKPADQPADPNLTGVIVNDPGLELRNGTIDGVRVATHGRAAVLASNDAGDIKVGDYLTSSSIPGVAVKATRPGPVIGTALAAPKDGKVVISINPQFWAGGTLTEFLTREGDSFSLEEDGEALSGLLVDAKAFAEQDAKLAALTSRVDEVASAIESLKQGSVAGTTSDSTPGVESEVSSSPSPSPDSSTLEPSLHLRSVNEVLADGSLHNALQVENNLEVVGELEVQSDVTLYANLIADTIHIAQALNVHGDTTLFGNLVVKGDASFEGEVTLGQNQAGLATIPRGGKEVEVRFTKPFVNSPIIHLTALGENHNYWIAKSDQAGFTIQQASLAKADITFTWTALTAKDPVPTVGEVVDENENGVADIDEVSEPANTPGESPSVTLTGESASPTPSSTPELTPSPSPSSSPTPDPSAVPAALLL